MHVSARIGSGSTFGRRFLTHSVTASTMRSSGCASSSGSVGLPPLCQPAFTPTPGAVERTELLPSSSISDGMRSPRKYTGRLARRRRVELATARQPAEELRRPASGRDDYAVAGDVVERLDAGVVADLRAGRSCSVAERTHGLVCPRDPGVPREDERLDVVVREAEPLARLRRRQLLDRHARAAERLHAFFGWR